MAVNVCTCARIRHNQVLVKKGKKGKHVDETDRFDDDAKKFQNVEGGDPPDETTKRISSVHVSDRGSSSVGQRFWKRNDGTLFITILQCIFYTLKR